MTRIRPPRPAVSALTVCVATLRVVFVGCTLLPTCLLGVLYTTSHATAGTPSAQWTALSPSGPIPTPRRDMCFVYEPINDLIIYIAGGQTYALSFAPSASWSSLNISAPVEGEERGVYDPVGQRVILLGSNMNVYALSAVAPSAWEAIATSGNRPAPRRSHAIAFDSVRRRLIVFGGADPVTLAPNSETWALTLDASPTWERLNNTGPTPPPVALALAYDPRADRLIAFGGSPDFGYAVQNSLWQFSLQAPAQWQELTTQDPKPSARIFASFVRDPVVNKLLLFGGYNGSALEDLWELSLDAGPSWTPLPETTPWPEGRWSHGAAYQTAGPSMIVCFGLNGAMLSTGWSLALTSPTPNVEIYGFAPLGGVVGDLVTIFGRNLDTATEVRFASVPSVIESATQDQLQARVPQGATTGPISVENQYGVAVSLASFFVGEVPEIDSASPPQARLGEPVRLSGRHFTGATKVSVGGAGSAPFVVVDDLTIDLEVDSLATTGPVSVTTPAATGTSGFDFVRLIPVITFLSPDSGHWGDQFALHGERLSKVRKVSIGGAGSAGFEILDDSTLIVTVDALATTGRVTVFEPGASAQSAADFIKLADDPRPRLLAVRDVPADQGGKVIVAWRASDLDKPWYSKITGYRVWRRVVLADVLTPAAGLSTRPLVTPDGAAVETYWESVAELPAAFLGGYAYVASTLRDSLEGDNPFTAFFVQALTADRFTFYNSNVDSGYSLDNLAPPTPGPFAVVYSQTQNRLSWQLRPTPDLREYRLYRSIDPDFIPGPATFVVATRETSYVDSPGAFAYKLAALDVHGNWSRFASVWHDGPVAVLASLIEAFARGDRIVLRWRSSGNAGLTARVFRRTLTTAWDQIGSVTADGVGDLQFEDTNIQVGTRYGYRLGITEPDIGEVFVGEVWVDSETPGFALTGIGPNPCRGDRVAVFFSLAVSTGARLELFDVFGRRLDARELDAMGPGRHRIDLTPRPGLSRGLYFVRLSQDGISHRGRIVVLD